VVDIAGHYDGPAGDSYEPSSAWLKSALPAWGQVLSLDSRARIGPGIHRGDPLPAAAPQTARGEVLEETKSSETYRARVAFQQPGYVLVKITWNPDLAVTVDGHQAPLLHVTPGFGAVPVRAGTHELLVAYRPGLLKPVLLLAGIAGFVLARKLFLRSRLLASFAGNPGQVIFR